MDLKRDGRIEVRQREREDEIEDVVGDRHRQVRGVGREFALYPVRGLVVPGVDRRGVEVVGHDRRQEHDRDGKDDRDYSRVIDAERQEARPTLDLSQPDRALRGLNGYLPHRLLHLDDDGGHDQRHSAEDDERDVVGQAATGRATREDRRDACGTAADDAGEDDERDTVADSVLGDELAEPHDHHSAGRQGEDDLEAREPVERRQDGGGRVLEQHGEPVRLAGSERDGQVAAPALDAPPAHLAFLLDLLDALGDHSHQLHDDGGVDVGVHAHRHHAEPRQTAA